MSDQPVHLRRLDDLKIWLANYNRGDVPAIRASIAEFGMNGALRVWEDGIVIAGNHALLALREMRDAGEGIHDLIEDLQQEGDEEEDEEYEPA